MVWSNECCDEWSNEWMNGVINCASCVPCNSTRCFCCQELISTTTFKSNQTDKTFKMYHRVNCKSSFIIYLRGCYICNIQYVGKSETPKHHSTLSSITAEKMSKIPMQFQLANISTSMIMPLTFTEKSLS